MYYGRKAMPVANKHLAQTEWKEQQDAHKRRMRTVKPGIDNRPPKEFPHLYTNGKKEQLLEGASQEQQPRQGAVGVSAPGRLPGLSGEREW